MKKQLQPKSSQNVNVLHNLSLPTYQVPNNFNHISGNIPDRIPPVFNNNILVSAIRYPDRDFLIYGDDFGKKDKG